MSAWTLIPCLVALREEFNRVSPNRDRGADGSIGDSAHASSSDHTPDEDSDVLRDHDSDRANEIHALDIDSSGPWPGERKGVIEGGWFDRTILALVAREKAEYESPTIRGRLQYVIWDGRIASRSWGWTWRDYSGPDPHINHAHFSARYLSSTEADTRLWGVATEEDDMPTAAEIADAVWNHTEVDPYDAKHVVRTGTWLRYGTSRPMLEDVGKQVLALSAQVTALGKSLTAAITALAGQDHVDEQALAAALAPGVAAVVVASLPEDRDDITAAELQESIVGALRELASPPATV